jgi:hypothetical protein
VFAPADIVAIHEAALRVLARTGVVVRETRQYLWNDRLDASEEQEDKDKERAA